MSVTARKLDPWYVDEIDTEAEVFAVITGGKSVYKIREHYMISISRKFVQMTAFYEQVGTSTTSFSFMTGGGASSSYSSTGRKWMCTKDKIKIVDTITGEGLESQVWEQFSEEVDLEKTPNTIRIGGFVRKLTGSNGIPVIPIGH